MRIVFVRHGHPDYAHDCLTELGHRHAEAVAVRLSNEKIDKVFSSSCGRAVQTAEHVAVKHGLEVEQHDFIREIGWGSIDDRPIFNDGHPWSTVNDMVAQGQSIVSAKWEFEEPFCRNTISTNAKKVGAGLDAWLATLGFVREGEFYRVGDPEYDTIVMVSHGGSSSAALSHLFNLPLPFVFETVCMNYTSITIVEMNGEKGSLISPRFELLNDSRHIADISIDNVYDR